MEAGGNISNGRAGVQVYAVTGAGRCRGSCRAVAVDDRCNESAVDETGECRMVWFGGEGAPAFAAVPIALYCKAPGVKGSASVAVFEFIGIAVLDSSGAHGFSGVIVRVHTPPVFVN